MLHGDVLGERARLSPDRTAFVFVPTGDRLTYAGLDARATRLARLWLGALGLAPGDRLGLLAHNAIEFVDAFFAAAKSGVILVPLSTRATSNELEGIVADSGLRVLLYGPEFAPLVDELRERTTVTRWIALARPDCLTRRSEAAVAPGLQPRRHVDDLLADLLPAVDPVPFDVPWPDPEHPLCLLYTSGTTGRPKGVVVPHRMVAWNACNTAVCWQLDEDDVSPIFTPLYHAGGLGAFLLPIFAAGGTIVLHRGFDPAEVWRTVEREGCTVVLGVPTIYKLLMDAPEFQTVDLSRVRWLISGGAPLPHDIIEAYQRRGVVFKQGYGLTEVGVNCFAMSVDDSVRKAGTIGRPLMFTRARLVREDGTDAEVDEVGELWLRGPHVCLGYWGNPEATAQALDAGGWFHTGDLAKRDADGFYTIAGRKKDMIISGGVNVYPAEIEAVLAAHPGVADAAVVGVPHDTWGEVGIAFVVRVGDEVTEEALAEYVGGRLAKYKVPKAFVFVDALPRTPYGKVVKDALRSAYLDGTV
jgi:fatty-acyl-CoA synthase